MKHIQFISVSILLLFVACSGDSDSTKQEQTITFNTLEPHNLSENTFELSATASSSLPVTFSSSDNTVASVSGRTVTLKKEGKTTITASQSGDENWFEARKVTRELTVNDDVSSSKKEQTITFAFETEEWFASQGELTLEATASSGLTVTFSSNSGKVRISGNKLTLLDTGSHYENEEITITASQSGNEEWKAAANVAVKLIITHDI
ncbi:MAG: hypothetical protein LBJ17_00605 [Dysgonamonadaceae bacterium]|jgi:hypothetical protein|nr:hypothetical protein [Dysgonamonadaceae bacterium]